MFSLKKASLSLLTFIILSASFTVFSLSLVMHNNISAFIDGFSDNIQLNISMKEGTSIEKIDLISQKLRSMDSVSKVQHISKIQALESFQPQLNKRFKDLDVNFSKNNPFPSSLEVDFKSSSFDEKIFERVSDALAQFSDVEDIYYPKNLASNFLHIKKSYLSVTTLFLLFILAAIFLVIGNVIRSSVMERSDEIEILELIGATYAYVQRPYIVQAALIGLISSFFAVILSYGICSFMEYKFSGFISQWWLGESIKFMSFSEIFYVIVLGTVICAVCAWLNLSFINTGWTAVRNKYAKN